MSSNTKKRSKLQHFAIKFDKIRLQQKFRTTTQILYEILVEKFTNPKKVYCVGLVAPDDLDLLLDPHSCLDSNYEKFSTYTRALPCFSARINK